MPFTPYMLNQFESELSNAQYTKLANTLALLRDNPFTVSSDCPHVTAGTYMQTATMRQLIASADFQEISQKAPQASRVAKVLIGDSNVPGLLESKTLFNPITLGVTSNGELAILSGQNRIVALLTAYAYSGVNVQDETFLNMRVGVFIQPYNLHAVVGANKTRPMTVAEIAEIQAAYKGVDITNSDSIRGAYVKKEINIGSFLYLMFMYLRSGDAGDNKDYAAAIIACDTITDATIAAAVRGFVSEFKVRVDLNGTAHKRYLASLKSSDWVSMLAARMFMALPGAIKQARVFTTNLAREPKQLSKTLALAVQDIELLPEKVKEAPVPSDVLPQEGDVKPQRKRRTKKSEVTEPVQQELVAAE